VVTGGRHQRSVPAPVIEEVGEQPDQLQQKPGDVGRDEADDNREQRNRDDARRGGEIAEIFETTVFGRFGGLCRHADFLAFCGVC
jgi:hypothetical protein